MQCMRANGGNGVQRPLHVEAGSRHERIKRIQHDEKVKEELATSGRRAERDL